MDQPRPNPRNYFTTYHFARDYLYSGAAVSFAATAAAATGMLTGTIPLPTSEWLNILNLDISASALFLASVLFLFLCHGLGHFANTTVAGVITCYLHRFKGHRSMYYRCYRPYKEEIRKIYESNFSDRLFPSQAEENARVLVSQLIELYRQHEASGYLHVARLYAICAFYRQLAFYLLLQVLAFVLYAGWWPAFVQLVLAVFALANHRRLIDQSGRAELAYISATHARLQREREALVMQDKSKNLERDLSPSGAL